MTTNEIITKYLGIPYVFYGNTLKGLDCINLCELVAKDRGIFIPNINHLNTTEGTYSSLFNLKDCTKLWDVYSEPIADSLVLFKINGVVNHVGYMLDDDQFIHIMKESKVTVDRVSRVNWNRRVVGYYKYIGSLIELSDKNLKGL